MVEPLWREVVGNTEPWRRGRLFLVLLAILTLCAQCVSIGAGILAGDVEGVLVLATIALIFWLQFYFIWIGVHWVRWISGGWTALSGFALVIWGIRDGASVAIILGIYCLCIGAYLGLAPSVYFFAKRQRETVRWLESVVVAAVFLVLVGGVTAGGFILFTYKSKLETEARRFANTAFVKIFAEHDTYFLLDHVSDRGREAFGGRERLTQFLQVATLQAGDVHDIRPAAGWLKCWYLFPAEIGSAGEMFAEGTGNLGPIRMHLKLLEADGRWKIDGVSWVFPATVPASSR